MTLDTIAVSHVDLEVPYPSSSNGSSFIPLPIRQNSSSEEKFQDFLNEVFTGSAYVEIRKQISQRYPLAAYLDQVARAAAVIRDSSFTCNTRYIIDTYLSAGTKVYAMDYALFSQYNASTHASDLLPDFSSPAANSRPVLECIAKVTGIKLTAAVWYVQSRTAPRMQQYFTDHAIWSDPNHNIGWSEYHWRAAKTEQCEQCSEGTGVWNLLKPEDNVLSVWSNNAGADSQTPSRVCDFWSSIAKQVIKLYNQDVGDVEELNLDQLVFNEEL